MMLERGDRQQKDLDNKTTETTETTRTTMTYDIRYKKHCNISGERDPLLSIEKQRQVELHNSFEMLASDDEDAGDTTDNDGDIDGDSDSNITTRRRRRPNKRPRQRHEQSLAEQRETSKELEDEDATSDGELCGEDRIRMEGKSRQWHASHSQQVVGWHPGPEHIGSLAKVDTLHYYYNNHNNHDNDLENCTNGGSSAFCTTTCNCPHSSSSLAIGSNSFERVMPREWRQHRGDGGEVMPPAQEPPAPKLNSRAGSVDPIAWTTVPLSAHNLAFPSTGTRPSPVEGRGSRGCWRASTQKDHIEAKCGRTRVGGRDHCQQPGSIVSPDQAQVQRCSAEGPRANLSARAVAVTDAEGRATKFLYSQRDRA